MCHRENLSFSLDEGSLGTFRPRMGLSRHPSRHSRGSSCTVKETTEVGPKDSASLQEKHLCQEHKGRAQSCEFHMQAADVGGMLRYVYEIQPLFGRIQNVKR